MVRWTSVHKPNPFKLWHSNPYVLNPLSLGLFLSLRHLSLCAQVYDGWLVSMRVMLKITLF